MKESNVIKYTQEQEKIIHAMYEELLPITLKSIIDKKVDVRSYMDFVHALTCDLDKQNEKMFANKEGAEEYKKFILGILFKVSTDESIATKIYLGRGRKPNTKDKDLRIAFNMWTQIKFLKIKRVVSAKVVAARFNVSIHTADELYKIYRDELNAIYNRVDIKYLDN